MPGFTRGRKLDKVGQDESDTAELFFTDVRVPLTNVVGEVDKGFAHMMDTWCRSGSARRSTTSPTRAASSTRPSTT